MSTAIYAQLGTNRNLPLRLYANGQEGIRITETGKIGIGITNPTEKLEINGNFKVSGTAITDSLSVRSISVSDINITGNTNYDSLHILNRVKVGSSVIIDGVNGTGTSNNIFTDATAPTELFIQSKTGLNHNTIINANNTGKLGIGTNNPQTKLHIYSSGENHTPDCGTGLRIEYYSNVPPDGCPGHAIWDLTANGGNYFNFTTPALSTPVMTLTETGNVGIGNSSPSQKLHVIGNVLLSGAQSSLLLANNTGSLLGEWGIEYVEGYDGNDKGLNFWKPSGSHHLNDSDGFGNYYLFINDDGKVGVNNGKPIAKLDIYAQGEEKAMIVRDGFTNSGDINFAVYANGHVYARDVTVQLTSFPDYVFDKNYPLVTLNELEQYISINKHLPGVPSEYEVKKNGINLGEMDATLLKKIEELTIYVIELKKENEQLKNRISKLEK